MPLSVQHGGAEKALVDLIKYSKEPSIKWLVVFTSFGPLVKTMNELNVETKVIPSGRLFNLVNYFRTVFQLANLIKKERVDLAIGWTGKAHLYNGPASIIARTKSSWFQMGLPSNNLSELITNLIPTKKIFCCSNFVLNQQKKLWPKWELKTILLGFDSEKFHNSVSLLKNKIKKNLGITADGKIIGIIGRLQTWKGMHTVIKAMPLVLKKHPDTSCIIVGGQHPYEKEYEVYLKKLIVNLKLENKVMMVGHQTNVSEWMSILDIFIHASDREPFGIVIPEAMALGKAIIAGDMGGPKEIIKGKINGLFCPFNDYHKMARQINFYLDNPALARKMASMAKIDSKNFTSRLYARRLTESLLSII